VTAARVFLTARRRRVDDAVVRDGGNVFVIALVIAPAIVGVTFGRRLAGRASAD
jgi:hypothetical protein